MNLAANMVKIELGLTWENRREQLEEVAWFTGRDSFLRRIGWYCGEGKLTELT